MKEALNSPYPNLLFRETLSNGQAVRKNWGTPTDVSFSNWVGSFNGTTSKIHYPINLKAGVYSFRIRFYFYTKSGYNWLFCGNTVNANIWFTTGSTLQTYGAGTRYVNGVAWAGINSAEWAYNELVYSGVTIADMTLAYLGTYFTGATEFSKCSIELVEIYKGTLTASEVKNMYDNDWNSKNDWLSSNVVGGNLISNGTFETSTGRTLGATWNIAGGKLNGVATEVAQYSTLPVPLTTLNKRYLLKFTVSNYVAGTVRLYVGGETLATVNANWEYSFEFIRMASSSILYVQGLTAFTGSIDNIEIYELTNKQISDLSCVNGVVEDKLQTITTTGVTVKKTNTKYSAELKNSLSSKIAYSNELLWTKSISIVTWAKITTWSWVGNLIANGKFQLRYDDVRTIYLSNDTGTTKVIAPSNSIKDNTWMFIAAVRKWDGKWTLYIGTTSEAPVVKGTPDSNIGTPTAGTSALERGKSWGLTGMTGNLAMASIYEGILSLEEFTQIWSETRKNII